MSFITQTRQQIIRGISGLFIDGIVPDRSPTASIDSLQLVANNTNLETFTGFYMNGDRLCFDKQAYDLIPYDKRPTHVKFTYTAGMSVIDFKANYPDICEAIQITAHAMWDGRGMNSLNIPPQAAQILAPYRRMNVHEV